MLRLLELLHDAVGTLIREAVFLRIIAMKLLVRSSANMPNALQKRGSPNNILKLLCNLFAHVEFAFLSL